MLVSIMSLLKTARTRLSPYLSEFRSLLCTSKSIFFYDAWTNAIRSRLIIATCYMFQFLRVLQRELAEVEKNKEAFMADFTQVRASQL